MVITLTMNPAVDHTIQVQQVVLGQTNHVQTAHIGSGGKGLNVSLALAKMGIPSLALGVIGGAAGELIQEVMDAHGVATQFTPLADQRNRVNIKIVDLAARQTTEFNESGPTISPGELAGVWESITHSLQLGTYLVCAGSLPPGAPHNFYGQVIAKGKEYGVRVVLDASGRAFKEALPSGPFLIKPNKKEAEEWVGQSLDSKKALQEAVLNMASYGPEMIILSLGEQGAIFYRQGKEMLWAKAIQCEVRSTTGCGDSMVASALAGLMLNLSWLEFASFVTATATRTAELAGTYFPVLSEIKETQSRIIVERLF